MLNIEYIGQAALKLSGWQDPNLMKKIKDDRHDPDIFLNFLNNWCSLGMYRLLVSSRLNIGFIA